MNKHFEPRKELTNGSLNDAGVRIFPSNDDLSSKFDTARSSLFKKCQKEDCNDTPMSIIELMIKNNFRVAT